jgi:hypothetical protein
MEKEGKTALIYGMNGKLVTNKSFLYLLLRLITILSFPNSKIQYSSKTLSCFSPGIFDGSVPTYPPEIMPKKTPDNVNWRFRVPDNEKICFIDGK